MEGEKNKRGIYRVTIKKTPSENFAHATECKLRQVNGQFFFYIFEHFRISTSFNQASARAGYASPVSEMIGPPSAQNGGRNSEM